MGGTAGRVCIGQSRHVERALVGVLFPQGPGFLDQPGYAGDRRTAGQLVGAGLSAAAEKLGIDQQSMQLGMFAFSTLMSAKGSRAGASPNRTVTNSTVGWNVGDPINNLTSRGTVPSWSAVRQRFWKNEVLNNSSQYSAANIERMKRGLAPQRVNPATGALESMELHHLPAQRNGGLYDVKPVWPDEHGAIDPFRVTGD